MFLEHSLDYFTILFGDSKSRLLLQPKQQGCFLQVSKLSWLALVVLIKSSAFWLDRVPFA